MKIYLILDNTGRGITVMTTNSDTTKPLEAFFDITEYENVEEIKANPRGYQLENDHIVALA